MVILCATSLSCIQEIRIAAAFNFLNHLSKLFNNIISILRARCYQYSDILLLLHFFSLKIFHGVGDDLWSPYMDNTRWGNSIFNAIFEVAYNLTFVASPLVCQTGQVYLLPPRHWVSSLHHTKVPASNKHKTKTVMVRTRISTR